MKHLLTDRRIAWQPCPLTEHTWSKIPQKNFWLDCTTSYVLNSEVVDLNLTKFIQDVQRWLPITVLKSKSPLIRFLRTALYNFANFFAIKFICYCDLPIWFVMPVCQMGDDRQILAESQHNFYFLPLCNSKTTGPIFTIFLQDLHIHKAMVHSVSERESKEWRWSILTSAKSPQN